MKKILQLFIFIFFYASIFAQDVTIDPEFKEFIMNDQDLTISWLDLEEHVTVTNNTNEVMNLRWDREIPENCPDQWETKICDNNTCYSSILNSNYESPPLPEVVPFVLQPGESFAGFILHVIPNGKAGCCKPKIHISRGEAPNDILATVEFDVRINDPECQLMVSVDEITKAGLKVFPNPMTDNFQLAGNDDNVVEELVVYNLIGRPVRTFNAQYENQFDMSGLPGGIYLVSLMGEGNEVLKTVRISRQLLRP